MPDRRTSLLSAIGPGLLVAATGVGAGDLATGAFAGSRIGLGVLWAVALGAAMKFLLTEGLTRWQLATGSTLLEGAVRRFGRFAGWCFLGYLVLWSYFVGAALMSACGVTAHALRPLLDARGDKVLYGVLHSLAALALLRLGGYRLFQRLMSACVGLMVAVVLGTAVALRPDWSGIARGLLVPGFGGASGIAWTIALIGGVGGTVTILCYGYWIREEGREDAADLRLSRVDLGCGYAVTGLFGAAMVVIGSRIEVSGGGAGLIVDLGRHLHDELGRFGPAARWAFLVGGWCAVFSSLLGVWQSVPYLFADLLWLLRAPRRDGGDRPPGAASPPYRAYQLALAVVPVVGLLASFEWAQRTYAIIGALFVPMLAGTLAVLNRRRSLGPMGNAPITTLLLLATLTFFLVAGALEVCSRLWR